MGNGQSSPHNSSKSHRHNQSKNKHKHSNKRRDKKHSDIEEEDVSQNGSPNCSKSGNQMTSSSSYTHDEEDFWKYEDEESPSDMLRGAVSSLFDMRREIPEEDRKSGFAFKMSLLFFFALANVIFLLFVMYGPKSVVAWVFFGYIIICAVPKFLFGTILPILRMRRCACQKTAQNSLDIGDLDAKIWNICAEETVCNDCGTCFDDLNVCPNCGSSSPKELPPLVSACVTVHHEYGEGLLAGVESFESSDLPFSKDRLQLVYIVDGRHDRKGQIDNVQCETVRSLLAKLYGVPIETSAIDSDGLVKFHITNGIQLISIIPDVNPTDRTAIYRGFLSNGVNAGMPFIVLLKDRNGGKRDSHKLFFEYMDLGIISKTMRFIMFVDSDMKFSEVKKDKSLKILYNHIKKYPQMGGGCGEIEVWKWQKNLITMMQYFEYKSNQFLAKTFEAFFGMVSCLPGAFCMIRPQAMEDVLNAYLKVAQSVVEKNQLDLGEDRTLTTLLLTAGWTTGYASDAIALTEVPANLAKLVRQRRRWTNSTLVNMFFLLKSTYNRLMALPLITSMTVELVSVFVLPCAIISLFFQIWVEAGVPMGFCVAALAIYLFLTMLISLVMGLDEKAYLFSAFAIIFGLMIILMVIYFVTDLEKLASQYWVETCVTVVWVFIICGAAVLNKRGMSVFSIIAPISWLILSPTLYVTLPIYAMCNFDDVSWGTR